MNDGCGTERTISSAPTPPCSQVVRQRPLNPQMRRFDPGQGDRQELTVAPQKRRPLVGASVVSDFLHDSWHLLTPQVSRPNRHPTAAVSVGSLGCRVTSSA